MNKQSLRDFRHHHWELSAHPTIAIIPAGTDTGRRFGHVDPVDPHHAGTPESWQAKAKRRNDARRARRS